MFNPNHPGSVCREAPSACFRSLTLHFACQRRSGFTLIEMMVVVTIIAILASITAVAVNSAKEKARQTDCMSNLRQLGTAIVTYRADNRGRNPDWLSKLYPTYIDDKRVYVCRSDAGKGMGILRPDNKYPEVIDNDKDKGSRHTLQNRNVKANSYLYEFSAAVCSWGQSDDFVKRMYGDNSGGGKTWAEIKEAQLAFGNDGGPYSSSRLPIIRCYHHMRYGKMNAKKDEEIYQDSITLNVAYAGNVVFAPLTWEDSIEPGEE